MDEETRKWLEQEHYERYETLAQKIGIKGLKDHLPSSWAETIRLALANGDEDLNTIKLRKWDNLAGATFSFGENFTLSHDGIWASENAKSLSLAERVCVLKHVAAHHLKDEEEPEEQGQTITQFARKYRMRISSERVGDNPHMVDSFQGDHYRCVLRMGKRQMTVYFSKGYGLGGKDPKIDEVLDCLASEAIVEEGFESWARNSEYGEDSRKAEKICKVCIRQTKRLQRFLGPFFQELLEAERECEENGD